MFTRRSVERVCLTCNAPFVTTADEMNWLAKRGYSPPLRCKSCRKQRHSSPSRRRWQTQRALALQEARGAPMRCVDCAREPGANEFE